MHLKNRALFAFFVPMFLMLAFSVIFLLFPHISSAAAGEIAVVKVDVANIRSGPSTDSNVLAQAGQDERMSVLEKSGDWCRVQAGNGIAGWVAGWLVTLETAATTAVTPANSGNAAGSGKTVVVTGDTVNIRSGPSTDNQVVTQVGQGHSLAVLEQTGDWYCVRLADGSTGWVASWLVALRSAKTNTEMALLPNKAGQTSSAVNTGKTSGAAGSEKTTVAAESAKPQTSATGQANNNGKLSNNEQASNISLASNTSLASKQSGEAVSLSVSTVNDVTKVVLKADVSFSYTVSFLSNPDRMVLDVQGITPGTLPLNREISNSKSVARTRLGHFQTNPDVTRLVIELKDGALGLDTLSADQKTLTVEVLAPNVSGSYKGKVIVIDPGHGGSDPGAMGAMGTKEKDLTLDIANQVAKILMANGAKVVMTRSSDVEVGLYECTDKANAAKADIYVSIHINANDNKAIGGTSTYIHNGADSTRIQESNKLARCVQNELVKSLGLRDIGVLKANFAVLRTSNMPAILAEVAFISNAQEEQLLRTEDFRKKAAEAIAKGIGLYFAPKGTS